MKKFIIVFPLLAVLLSCEKVGTDTPTPQYNEYQTELIKAMTSDEPSNPLFQSVSNSSTSSYNPDNTCWVDLGLPSGTLWADRNIGANSALDLGWYLSWGEVTPKSNYSWSKYKYWDGTSTCVKDASTICILSKYDGSYRGPVLTDADDPCALYLGGDMPTYNDFIELVQNTTIEFRTIDISALTGIPALDVIMFTSKVDTTKYIVLPLAGQRVGTTYYSGFRNTRYYSQYGKVGYYWMDTTYIPGEVIPYRDEAYHFAANAGFYDIFGERELTTYIALDRCDGFSVRAVKYKD